MGCFCLASSCQSCTDCRESLANITCLLATVSSYSLPSSTTGVLHYFFSDLCPVWNFIFLPADLEMSNFVIFCVVVKMGLVDVAAFVFTILFTTRINRHPRPIYTLSNRITRQCTFCN